MRAVAAALAQMPLSAIAEALGRDETTACRVRSDETKVALTDAIRVLYAAGMKVVSQEKVCVDRATYEALSTIATKAMAQPDMARRLVWDEEQ